MLSLNLLCNDFFYMSFSESSWSSRVTRVHHNTGRYWVKQLSSVLICDYNGKNNNKKLLLINSVHKHNPSVWKINKLWFHWKRRGRLSSFGDLFRSCLLTPSVVLALDFFFHQTLIDCRILLKCIINLYLFRTEGHWSMEIAFLGWPNWTMLSATAQELMRTEPADQ